MWLFSCYNFPLQNYLSARTQFRKCYSFFFCSFMQFLSFPLLNFTTKTLKSYQLQFLFLNVNMLPHFPQNSSSSFSYCIWAYYLFFFTPSFNIPHFLYNFFHFDYYCFVSFSFLVLYWHHYVKNLILLFLFTLLLLCLLINTSFVVLSIKSLQHIVVSSFYL